jgi:hypothetical protein
MSVLGPPSFSSGMRELLRRGKVFQLWLVTVSLELFRGVWEQLPGEIAYLVPTC